MHVLPLPTDDQSDALTRLRHIEDGAFRRVPDSLAANRPGRALNGLHIPAKLPP